MNTEKMIPIDFPRNITPFVPGDVYYNNFVDAEFTMDQRDADEFNNADPKGEFNTYFIVSFADRPNTTGKQPVADDVVVDWSGSGDYPVAAKDTLWGMRENGETWKPNHAAMLAKFKEQGANTMYTGKKAGEATHIIGLYFKKIIPGNMPEFLDNDGVWMLSSFSVKSALNHKSLIELSRPIGERKEDHTIDGILKKAQPQGAKAYEVALMIEALDDNPDEPVPVAESMPFSSDHYVTSPKDFGAVKDDEQVIEPWVADQLDDLINPVSEGCQAGDVISVPYSELPPCNGEIPKPVFTQEMSDAGRMPKVGASIDVLNSSKHPMFVNVPVLYISKTMCVVDNFGVDEAFHPHKCYILAVDNRTDKDKLKDEIYKQIVTPHIPDTYLDDVIDSLVNAGKFTIALNK